MSIRNIFTSEMRQRFRKAVLKKCDTLDKKLAEKLLRKDTPAIGLERLGEIIGEKLDAIDRKHG